MIDADAFAALLCDWCLEVRSGQQVLVNASTLAAPVAWSMHNALLQRGAWPLLRLSPPELAAEFYHQAGEAQLDGFAPLELTEVQAVDAVLGINAPSNTRALAGVDPATVTRAASARRPTISRCGW